MWHCWCRFLFEKKMRWIFKRKKSKNQIAVYQSFDQSSNAILIHSEFMGVFRNGREALMLMKRHGRYSISTFPFLNSFLNTRFCQALFIRELFPKRVVIVGMVSTVAYKAVLGLVPFFWKPLHKPPQKFENRAMGAFWEICISVPWIVTLLSGAASFIFANRINVMFLTVGQGNTMQNKHCTEILKEQQ